MDTTHLETSLASYVGMSLKHYKEQIPKRIKQLLVLF